MKKTITCATTSLLLIGILTLQTFVTSKAQTPETT